MGMKKKQEIKKQVKEIMISIYYPLDNINSDKLVDWMGYPFDSFDDLTYHHITKASILRFSSKDDKATLQNGALLTDLSHQILHKIETIEPDLYELWNSIFILINKSRKYPSDDILDIVKKLQKVSEETIDEYNNKKRH